MELLQTGANQFVDDLLANPDVATGDLGDTVVSLDKTKIALIGDLELDGTFELFTVEPDAADLVRVSGNLNVAGLDVGYFTWR